MMNNIECRRSYVCRFKLHNKRCLLTPLCCEISSALSVRKHLRRLLTDSILPSNLQDWHPDLRCRFNVHGKGSFERSWYSITISMPCGQFESAIKLPCLRIDFLFCDNKSLFLLNYDRCWKMLHRSFKTICFSDNRSRKLHVWCLNQVLKFRCWSWGFELRTSRSGPWCRWAVTLSFCELTFHIQFFYDLLKGWSSRWNIS